MKFFGLFAPSLGEGTEQGIFHRVWQAFRTNDAGTRNRRTDGGCAWKNRTEAGVPRAQCRTWSFTRNDLVHRPRYGRPPQRIIRFRF